MVFSLHLFFQFAKVSLKLANLNFQLVFSHESKLSVRKYRKQAFKTQFTPNISSFSSQKSTKSLQNAVFMNANFQLAEISNKLAKVSFQLVFYHWSKLSARRSQQPARKTQFSACIFSWKQLSAHSHKKITQFSACKSQFSAYFLSLSQKWHMYR